MSNCNDYPTPNDAKTFKLDAITENERVTLEQDRTNPASDGKTKKTMWGIENDATLQRDEIEQLAEEQRDEIEQLAENQREQFDATFTAQFTYAKIGNISDFVGDTLTEADKLNSYQYPDDSGDWYGPIQSQTFPITIPVDPTVQGSGWSLVTAASQEWVANNFSNTNLLSNHNFLIASPDDSQPPPSASPTSYPPGFQIFSGVFANETTGISNLTYIDGRVSFSGGDFYMSVPNRGAIEYLTAAQLTASVADFDGKPRTRGVSFALVGDEYRVTVGIDALEDAGGSETLLGSVKFEQGSVATGHEVVSANNEYYNPSSVAEMLSTGGSANDGDKFSVSSFNLGDNGASVWERAFNFDGGTSQPYAQVNDDGIFVYGQDGEAFMRVDDLGVVLNVDSFGLVKSDQSKDTQNQMCWLEMLNYSRKFGCVKLTGSGNYFIDELQDLDYHDGAVIVYGANMVITGTKDYSGEPISGSRKPVFAFLCNVSIIRDLTVTLTTDVDTTSETVKQWAHAMAFGGNPTNIADFVKVFNCKVFNSWHSGIISDYCRKNEVTWNRVQNCPGTGIFTTCVTDSNEIAHNTVSDTGDDSIFASYVLTFTDFGEGTKVLSIHDNYTLRSGEKGIGWGGAYKAHVYDNTIQRTHLDAIRETQGSTMYRTKLAIIENNVIEGVRTYAGIHGTPLTGNTGAISITAVDHLVGKDNEIEDVRSYGSTYGYYIVNQAGTVDLSGGVMNLSSISDPLVGGGKGGVFKNSTNQSKKVTIRNLPVENYENNAIEYRYAKKLIMDDSELDTQGTGAVYGYRFDNIVDGYLFRNSLPAGNLATNSTITITTP